MNSGRVVPVSGSPLYHLPQHHPPLQDGREEGGGRVPKRAEVAVCNADKEESVAWLGDSLPVFPTRTTFLPATPTPTAHLPWRKLPDTHTFPHPHPLPHRTVPHCGGRSDTTTCSLFRWNLYCRYLYARVVDPPARHTVAKHPALPDRARWPSPALPARCLQRTPLPTLHWPTAAFTFCAHAEHGCPATFLFAPPPAYQSTHTAVTRSYGWFSMGCGSRVHAALRTPVRSPAHV